MILHWLRDALINTIRLQGAKEELRTLKVELKNENELDRYVAKFEQVTELEGQRQNDEIIINSLTEELPSGLMNCLR